MGIKVYNPYTPSRRNMTGLDFDVITTDKPEKSLLVSKKKTAGRNNQGKITVRHHGGGNRQKYRLVDFKRNKDGIPAKVATIEYDPNRTANIALIVYADGAKSYILAPAGLKVGDTLMNGAEAVIKGLQQKGYKVVCFSGGFRNATKYYAEKLGLDGEFANILHAKDGLLTGQVGGEMMFNDSKGQMLKRLQTLLNVTEENTIAVGDGANDLSMFKYASKRVAFCAKPILKQNANIIIEEKNLCNILSYI